MAYKLTPKQAHPITGFRNSVVGWQFAVEKVWEVFEGMRIVQRGGWTWDLHPDPEDTSLQRLAITPARPMVNAQPVLVHNRAWFYLDGDNIGVLTPAEVDADYDVEQFELPPEPPPPVVPEPEQPQPTPEENPDVTPWPENGAEAAPASWGPQ